MTPADYQRFTNSVAIYPQEIALEYLCLQLASEAGEVAGKLAKAHRDDHDFETMASNIMPELGDVLWYVSQICNEFGWSIEEVMEKNRDKLLSRRQRGVLQGSGDNR